VKRGGVEELALICEMPDGTRERVRLVACRGAAGSHADALFEAAGEGRSGQADTPCLDLRKIYMKIPSERGLRDPSRHGPYPSG